MNLSRSHSSLAVFLAALLVAPAGLRAGEGEDPSSESGGPGLTARLAEIVERDLTNRWFVPSVPEAWGIPDEDAALTWSIAVNQHLERRLAAARFDVEPDEASLRAIASRIEEVGFPEDVSDLDRAGDAMAREIVSTLETELQVWAIDPGEVRRAARSDFAPILGSAPGAEPEPPPATRVTVPQGPGAPVTSAPGRSRRAAGAKEPRTDPRAMLRFLHDRGRRHFRFGLPLERLFAVPLGEGEEGRDAVLTALADARDADLEAIPFMGPTADRFPLDHSGYQVPVRGYQIGDDTFGSMFLLLWSHDLEEPSALRVGRYPVGVVTAIELVPLGELEEVVTSERAARQWLQDRLARQRGEGLSAPAVPEAETAVEDAPLGLLFGQS